MENTTDIKLLYLYSLIKDLQEKIKGYDDKIKEIEVQNTKRINGYVNEINRKNNDINKLRNDIDKLRNDLNNEIKKNEENIKKIEDKFEKKENELKNCIEEIDKKMYKKFNFIYYLNMSKKIIDLEKKFPEKKVFLKIKNKIMGLEKINDTFLELKIGSIMGVLTKKVAYFNQGIEKFYDNIICKCNYIFENSSRFKDSFKYFGNYLFEELIGKNGKNENKIIEFDVKFDDYKDSSNWNAFFIRNFFHKYIYSNYKEINVNVINDIYDAIKDKCDEYISYDKPKHDMSAYIMAFERFEIMKFIKFISNFKDNKNLIKDFLSPF